EYHQCSGILTDSFFCKNLQDVHHHYQQQHTIFMVVISNLMATLALLSLFKTFYLIFKYGNCKQQQQLVSGS
ncbi:hypothetical protein DERP_013225, partial [Dermatophagoides pteronyssinus]